VYVGHLRVLVIIIYCRYLILLPVVLAAKWGWFATPVTALIAFVLMGVEAAACEVEP
jgi:predicted membrane chloride channel (bestrophin family)